MHLIATYLPVLMLYAFKTSENVPSPFFEIKRYSTRHVIQNELMIGTYCAFLLFILITELKTSKDQCSAQSVIPLRLKLLFNVYACVQSVKTSGTIFERLRQLFWLMVTLLKVDVSESTRSQSRHCSSKCWFYWTLNNNFAFFPEDCWQMLNVVHFEYRL